MRAFMPLSAVRRTACLPFSDRALSDTLQSISSDNNCLTIFAKTKVNILYFL